MNVLEQSRNLLNVVGEGSSRNRLDQPLLTPPQLLEVRVQNITTGKEGRVGGGGDGGERKGEREKGSVSLDQGR